MTLVRWYNTYKPEILTAAGILVPFALLGASERFTGARYLTLAIDYWFVSIPWMLASGLALLSSALVRRSRSLRFAPMRCIARQPNRYRCLLDATDGVYYLLGMSAEEFQREIDLKDYFARRAASAQPISELRVLLLHPDADNFRRRILEVNPGCDIEALIARKKQIIKSLHFGLTSLPPGTLGSVSIRFFDSYPIWMMQFYRELPENDGGVNRAVVMIHLPRQHSKRSPSYLVSKADDPVLFASFYRYFEQLWDTGLPIGPDGEFPRLYAAHSDDVRVIALDFDGVVVESSAAKREVFFSCLDGLSDRERSRVADFYDTHESATRTELLAGALRILRRTSFEPDELAKWQRRYSEAYRLRVPDIALVRQFERFHEVFKARYKFAIASNAPTEEIEAILREKGIYDWFSHVSGFPKSKVASLKALLRAEAIEPGNVLFIGDATEDLIAAQALGTRFVGRLRPGSRAESFQGQLTFHTYDELVSMMYTFGDL